MLSEHKKEMINRVIKAIQAEATFVRENEDISTDMQIDQMDVLLDVYHFLSDYERNIQILNKYNSDHRFDKEK